MEKPNRLMKSATAYVAINTDMMASSKSLMLMITPRFNRGIIDPYHRMGNGYFG